MMHVAEGMRDFLERGHGACKTLVLTRVCPLGHSGAGVRETGIQQAVGSRSNAMSLTVEVPARRWCSRFGPTRRWISLSRLSTVVKKRVVMVNGSLTFACAHACVEQSGSAFQSTGSVILVLPKPTQSSQIHCRAAGAIGLQDVG